jgi:PKD repeat protein
MRPRCHPFTRSLLSSSLLSLSLTLVSLTAGRAAAQACTIAQTSLVSHSTAGATTVANDNSSQQDISADGRYVVFRSAATDIVSRPLNRPLGINLYLRDRLTGNVEVLDDHPPGQGFSDAPDLFAISGDGRSVAFQTNANNVVAGGVDTNAHLDVYVKRFDTNTFVRASVPDSSIATSSQSKQDSSNFSISGDGRYVAFVSNGAVFSPEYYNPTEPPSSEAFHIYVRDIAANRTYLVTHGVNGAQSAPLNGHVGRPALTANGLLLAFTTDSTNLRGFTQPTAHRDVYVAAFNGTAWDVIQRIPIPGSGIGSTRQDELSISPDGRYVAYVATETNGAGELYLFDRLTSATIRPRPNGTTRPIDQPAQHPRLGYDAVVWQDYDLTNEGPPGSYWYRISTATLIRVGRESNGALACCGANGTNGDAQRPALSADGRWAVYDSGSPRITPPLPNGNPSDGNGTYDVFVQRMTSVPATTVPDFTFLCTGLSCTFDATPTQSACLVSSYSWAFGDGFTGSSVNTAHAYATGGQRHVTLTVTDASGVFSITKLVTPMTNTAASAGYVPLDPCRLWDTRTPGNGRIANGQELILNVVSPTQGCAPNPNARAVSINVAAIAPDSGGFLSAYATGNPPLTSVLNFEPLTSPRANNMIIPVAANGTIALRPSVLGAVDLIVDLNGYFTDAPATGVTALGFQPLTPCRVYDSRDNSGAPYAPGEGRNIQVKGLCGIPTGAPAASLNAAVVAATTPGHLTLFTAGTPVPNVSNINYPATPTGATANGARLKLAASTPDLGTLMSVYGGTAHLLVDANGYFKSDASLRYIPLTPCRALDTREAEQAPALQQQVTRAVQIRGNCGVPPDAKAAMMNLTVIGPTGTGYVVAFPSGIALPGASTINFAAGELAQANGTIVPLSQVLSNDLSLYGNNGTVHVVIDVFGYFG